MAARHQPGARGRFLTGPRCALRPRVLLRRARARASSVSLPLAREPSRLGFAHGGPLAPGGFAAEPWFCRHRARVRTRRRPDLTCFSVHCARAGTALRSQGPAWEHRLEGTSSPWHRRHCTVIGPLLCSLTLGAPAPLAHGYRKPSPRDETLSVILHDRLFLLIQYPENSSKKCLCSKQVRL